MSYIVGLGLNLITRSSGSLGFSNFGFNYPETTPTDFPGTLLDSTIPDATNWTIQNPPANDDKIDITRDGEPGLFGRNDANGFNLEAIYTHPDAATEDSRYTALIRVAETDDTLWIDGSSLGGFDTTGWKAGDYTYSSGANPLLRVQFKGLVTAHVDRAQLYDITALLKQKWFIITTIGQSNRVGYAATLDPVIDVPAPGCVYFPGSDGGGNNAAELDGSGNGLPSLAMEPMAHSTFNEGGGPNASYLAELRKHIPADYTLVFVATAWSGGGFDGGGTVWNKNGTATAYNNFWKQSRNVWSLAPEGSIMGGVIVNQGESDWNAAGRTVWQSDVDGCVALLNEIRAEPGWGEVPIIISEIGGIIDGSSTAENNANAMIELQQKLATGSGDALEYTRCAYVPRPFATDAENMLPDNLHFTQEANRERGVAEAKAHRDIIYGVAPFDTGSGYMSIAGVTPTMVSQFGKGIYRLNGAESSFDDIWDLSRAGSAWTVGEDRVMTEVATNEPRLLYTDGEREGVHVTASVTNDVVDSWDLENGTGIFEITCTAALEAAEVGPDGATGKVSSIIADAASSSSRVQQGVPGSRATLNTQYMIVKAGGYEWARLQTVASGEASTTVTADLNLTTGAWIAEPTLSAYVIDYGKIELDDGWWIVYITTLPTGAAANRILRILPLVDAAGSTGPHNGTDGILHWASGEISGYWSGHIETNGSAATRAAETLSAADVSAWLGADPEGTLVVKWRHVEKQPATNTTLSLTDGGNSPQAYLWNFTGDTQHRGRVLNIADGIIANPGVTEGDAGSTLLEMTRSAISWDASDYEFYAGGDTVSGSLSGVMAGGQDTLDVGGANRHVVIDEILYYPAKFTAAELVAAFG